MPRDGAGVYAPPAGTKGQAGTPISSAKYNGLIDDLTADANNARPVGAGGTGAQNADQAAVKLGLISAKDLAGDNVVTGTANAIAIATDRVYTSHSNSTYLAFKAGFNSIAGGTTVALDAMGAVLLRKIVAAGDVDINSGDLIKGGIYHIRYDPTINIVSGTPAGGFILLNPGTSGGYLVGDFFDTARTLSTDWLKRDGALYLKATYPELGAILPALPDGVSWNSLSTSIPTGRIAQVINNPSGTGFIAWSTNGTNSFVWTSPDAVTWTQTATITGFIAGCGAAVAGIYVALDNNGKFSTSNNLTTWSAPALVGASIDYYSGIVYALGMFVVAGGNTGGAPKLYTSVNGTTWTSRTITAPAGLNNVKFGNGTFVAFGGNGGGDGFIRLSTDGINWATGAVSITGGDSLADAVYGNGLFVFVSKAGKIFTSPNLTSFTQRTSGVSVDLKSIVYSTSGFLIVGASGTALISSPTSGTVWTVTPTGIGGDLLTSVVDAATASRYIVGGGSTSTAALAIGLRTLPTQFQVPNDNPTYGWIKAVS